MKTKEQWVWAMVCSIGNIGSAKFSQMMILGWPRPTLQWTPCPYIVKHLKFLEPKVQWSCDMVCSLRLLGLYISFKYLTFAKYVKIISLDWPWSLLKRSWYSISDPCEHFRLYSISFLFSSELHFKPYGWHHIGILVYAPILHYLLVPSLKNINT